MKTGPTRYPEGYSGRSGRVPEPSGNGSGGGLGGGGLDWGEVGGYYGGAARVDGGEGLFQDRGQVGGVGDRRGVGAAGHGGYPGQVRLWLERDVEVVGHRGRPGRVDAQGGLL